MISCERGYIEISEFPRADHAIIVDAVTGKRTEVDAGSAADALLYEMQDMEEAVSTDNRTSMKLELTKDVMDLMTGLRKEWGLRYPGEIW